MSGQTYTLKYPVQGLDGELTAIEIPERITAGQLMATDKAEGNIGKLVELIAAVTQEPVNVIKKLDSEDLIAIGELMGN